MCLGRGVRVRSVVVEVLDLRGISRRVMGYIGGYFRVHWWRG